MRWLLTGIILAFIGESIAKPSFVLTGPKKFQKGQQERLCVTFYNTTQNGQITLNLKLSETESQKYEFPIGSDCYTIDVPDVETTWEGGSLNFTAVFQDGTTLNGSKKVVFQDKSPITLIQTDKPWYKPGQLVRFRMLSLDYHLKPILKAFGPVQIEDPNGVIVEQWKEVGMKKGMAELELQLSSEPVQGAWKIKATQDGTQTTQEFSVKEFELPRFEVQINAPSKVPKTEPIFEIETCARYTYGQPVQMNYTLTLVLQSSWSWYWRNEWPRIVSGALSVKDDKETQKMTLTGKGLGCHKTAVNVSEFVKDYYYSQKIGLLAVVTEDGTGITFNSTKEVDMEYASFNLKFSSQDSFKLGVPVVGEVKLTSNGKDSVANRDVQLCISATCINSTFTEVCSNFTTDAAGAIPYSFVPVITNCTTYSLSAKMEASGRTTQGHSSVQQVYSPSGRVIYIHDIKTDGSCQEEIEIPLLFNGGKGDELTVQWQVISRGDIVLKAEETVSFDKSSQIDFKLPNNLLKDSQDQNNVKEVLASLRKHRFTYNVTAKDGPVLTVLAYSVAKNGEVLTAAKRIDVNACFPNKVEMKWSKSKVKPGDKVKLTVSGHHGSYCGTSVVDKSVTLLQPENQLQESNILSKLSDFLIKEYEGQREVTYDGEYCLKQFPESADRAKRSVWRSWGPRWRFSTYHKDPIAAFDTAGLFVISNLVIETRPCQKDEFQPIFLPDIALPMAVGLLEHGVVTTASRPVAVAEVVPAAVPFQSENESADLLTSSVEVRSYFPETWLWEGVIIDDDGQHEQTVESPHTITTWVGRTLCVSPEVGFGMSPKAELEVFQLFFVELNLPYSVKRGEILTLKISTFNYAAFALPIVVRMQPSAEYEIVSGNTGSSKCVQSQTKAVHIFKIKPKALGNVNITVDALIDELHDAPCGPEVIPSAKDTVVKPLLVLPEGLPVEKTFSGMLCPKDFDEDKVTIWNVTVPENVIEGSARGWVTVVGDLMGPAVTGLSSLVRMPTGCGEQNMVIFSPIVYVMQYLEATKQSDPQISKKAIGYLKTGYQRELTYRHDDGSYSAFGKSDNSGSMWLTAFVVRSFAGANKFISIDQNDFEKSFKWIVEHQMENGCFPSIGKVLHHDLKGGITDDASPVGLTAYVVAALTEANVVTSEKVVQNALVCLKAESNQTDYVSSLVAYALIRAGDKEGAASKMALLLEKAKRASGLLWWEQGENKALAVEMTAYNIMTLTLLAEGSEAKTYKVHATSAVRWIARQRNGNGGFHSTQDTVVGLQAIALYAATLSLTDLDMMVRIDATNFEEAFRVVEDRKLVQKQIDLPVVPTTVEIDAVGQGCILAQAVLRYNIPVEKDKESFKIKTDVSNELEVSGCVQYLDSDISNMAVVDIEVLSGHVPNKDSVKNLKEDSANGIKRIDVNDGHVYLYYDGIDAIEKCFKFLLDQEYEVADLKPASVVAYDYYATQKRGEAELLPPKKLQKL